MSKLTMMIGIPGSGKSYLANELQKESGAVLYCPDDIRIETGLKDGNREDNNKLFTDMHNNIINDLMAGKDVIYDATNLNSKKRVAFLNQIKKLDVEKECIVVLRLFEDCLKGNNERERHVPENEIKRKLESFEPPVYGEGWDKITLHYTDNNPTILGKPEDVVVKNWDVSHDSKYHLESIGEHIQMVVDNVDKDNKELYYAALLHDEGKAFVKKFENFKGEPTENAHFYGHEHVSAYNSFFYDIPAEIKLNVAWLCNNHMKIHDWKENPGSKSEKKMADMVDSKLFQELLDLGDADNKGRRFEREIEPEQGGLFG